MDDDDQVSPPECTTGGECDDGDLCNGAESCDPSSGTCAPGDAISCDDFDPCTADTCDSTGGCVNSCTAGGAAWHGRPCCIDDAAHLMRCVATNFPAGTVAYQVRIEFAGGNATATNPVAAPAGWDDTTARLDRCPAAPAEDPRCETPLTGTSSAATGAVTISVVCRPRPDGSPCAAGERSCVLFDPASRMFVTSEYCSNVDPMPTAPPATQALTAEMASAFGWTDFEIVEIFAQKDADRCVTPDTANAPEAPHAECAGFESGSWQERCCSCCARGGGDFEADANPVAFGSCTCQGVSLTCP